MKKATLTLLSALAASNSLMGATYSTFSEEIKTYYSTDTTPHPTSGDAWIDGSGQNGSSTTYRDGHKLVILEGHTVRTHKNTEGTATDWNYHSIDLAGTFHSGMKANVTNSFNSDINVVGKKAHWRIGNEPAHVYGTGRLVVSSDTKITFRETGSTSSGSLTMDLEIVGDGTIAFDYASSSLDYMEFNNVSSAFTGIFDANSANDVTLRFGAGSDTSNASLILGRQAWVDNNDPSLGYKYDKDVKLDLHRDIAFKEVKIDGQKIADGVYTYDELVAMSEGKDYDFSNNLIDGDGKLYVGVAVPEPTTAGLLGLGAMSFILRRRREEK